MGTVVPLTLPLCHHTHYVWVECCILLWMLCITIVFGCVRGPRHVQQDDVFKTTLLETKLQGDVDYDWSQRERSPVSISLAALNLNVSALIVSRLSQLFYLIYKVIEFHSVIFLWREYTISRGISTICTWKELHPALNRLHRCFNKQNLQLFLRSFSLSVTFQSKLEERFYILWIKLGPTRSASVSVHIVSSHKN